MSNQPLVTVDNLTLTTSKTKTALVKNVSLRINPAEKVGIIGESGSGKTLSALAIMGLIPSQVEATGSITTLGVNPLTATERTMAALRGQKIAMVFQEPMTALNPVKTIAAQLTDVFRLHQQNLSRTELADRLDNLLKDVGLQEISRIKASYPHELSGGQRQRCLIAMALALSPDLLICDEPTTALDAAIAKEIMELIVTLTQKRGTALLLITHDLQMAARHCDRLLVMNRGQVVEEGPTHKILSQPSSSYTTDLIAASDLSARDEQGRFYTKATPSYQPGVQHQQRTFPAPGAPVVLCQNLSKTYAKKGIFRTKASTPVLHDISFTVQEHERLGIVGASGCGKSTLLKMIAGLEKPSSGKLAVTAELNMVFQDPHGSFNPRMTIGNAIAEPLLATGMDRFARADRVREVLEEVGLPASAAHRYPHEFSGGQRQRLSLARAIAARPGLLLADEAVSALDVSVRAGVLNLLDDLTCEYGLTLIFVSHDLSVIQHMTDRVLVVEKGTIVEQGTPDELLHNPQHPFTKQLVKAVS